MLQISPTIDRLIDQLSFVEPLSDTLQTTIGQWLRKNGEPAKKVKDALNGVWLEHPLHPMLTDVPIGAWTCSTLLDVAGLPIRRMRAAADLLVAVGCLGAVGAALAGVADWQDTYGHERRVGLVHGLLNTAALVLFTCSLRLRLAGGRKRAVILSLLGYATASGSAYLGGDLVYRLGTQVNRNAWIQAPEEWTAAANESDMGEGRLVRGDAAGIPVLLVRQGGRIHALGAVCPHAGGPLNEGTIEESSVVCPWHGSQFELRDGAIVHGPASVKPILYDARVSGGKVEVRRRPE